MPSAVASDSSGAISSIQPLLGVLQHPIDPSPTLVSPEVCRELAIWTGGESGNRSSERLIQVLSQECRQGSKLPEGGPGLSLVGDVHRALPGGG